MEHKVRLHNEQMTARLLNDHIREFTAMQDCNQGGEYIRYQWFDRDGKDTLFECVARNPITDEKVNLVENATRLCT